MSRPDHAHGVVAGIGRPADRDATVVEAGSGADLRPASLFFEVFVLGRAVRELLATSMADGPLDPEAYAIYSAVFEPEAVTPSALSASLSMPLTTVMDWIGAMERRGHLRRRPHPRDGRATLVSLTVSGLAAHREANRRFEAAYARFLDELVFDEETARPILSALRTAVVQAREPR